MGKTWDGILKLFKSYLILDSDTDHYDLSKSELTSDPTIIDSSLYMRFSAALAV